MANGISPPSVALPRFSSARRPYPHTQLASRG